MRKTSVIFSALVISFLAACTQTQPSDTGGATDFNQDESIDTSETLRSPKWEKEGSGTISNTMKRVSLEALRAEGFELVRQDIFKIDSVMIESIPQKSKRLSGATAALLVDDKGRIDSYLLIDSLKNNDGYEAYQEAVSIGQIANAEAYAVNLVELEDSTILAIWAVSEVTKEACPYYAGIKVYATAIYDGVPQDVISIGEISASSDAPAYSKVTKKSTITVQGEIKSQKKEVVGEAEGTEEMIRTDKMWTVSAGDISLADENSY